MTRETRIAMLVGLLFIVMFGLVLSELTGSTSSTPPKTLTNPINDPAKTFAPVMEGGSLAIDQGRDNPILLPGSDLAKEDEPAADPCAISSVDITVLPPTVRPGGPESDNPIHDIAADTHKPDAPQPLMYVVKEKDNFIKIARAFYGADNEKAYVEIAKANQDQVKGEAGLKVGQKLVIPAVPGVKFTPDAPKYTVMTAKELKNSLAIRTPGSDPRKLTAVPPAPKDANAAPRLPAPRVPDVAKTGDPVKPIVPDVKTYEVRKGDSLGKIAKLFLKSDSREAVQKLCKANPSLKAPDKLQVGMKLEIPI